MKTAAEARRTPRKTLRTMGNIVTSRHADAIECNVLDLSATGAKLALLSSSQRKAFTPSIVIPDEFSLEIPRDNTGVECRLAWQRNGEIGVEFTSTFRQLKSTKTSPKASPGGLRKAK